MLSKANMNGPLLDNVEAFWRPHFDNRNFGWQFQRCNAHQQVLLHIRDQRKLARIDIDQRSLMQKRKTSWYIIVVLFKFHHITFLGSKLPIFADFAAPSKIISDINFPVPGPFCMPQQVCPAAIKSPLTPVSPIKGPPLAA